jgi:hypothetical protein
VPVTFVDRALLHVLASSPGPPTPEEESEAVMLAEQLLRQDIATRGGQVVRVGRMRLLNGDIEVRVEYKAKRGMDA